ncbi:helix-turn-helix transcriptional regulator [Tomitella biformata]|uniref:helix-turn-helix transcriptional regulator n=1 Tax=Tomitella biformata TaxID=630403 RepID=UPI000464BC4B|nr:YafY family protein [Tomitella biformata]
MANTSSRTLRLLSMLQDRRHWPGAELAARLEVSPRTLRRDIDRLRELGYPVTAGRGVAGGYQLAAGSALPPLLLDDDEAIALVVGLHAAAQGGVQGAEEASARALAKVVPVLPAALRARLEAVRAMTMSAPWRMEAGAVDPHTLTTLAVACRNSQRMGFDYTAADGTPTARLVEPHRVVFLGQRWYLVAYDLTRHDWRSFRQDRMAMLSTAGQSFRPRELPAEDAAEFVRAGIAGQPAEFQVAAVIDAPAAVVARRIGRWAAVTAVDAARCSVTMTAENLDWPAMALGSVGADFHVRSPPELIAHLREWSERFGRAVAASGPRAPGSDDRLGE